LQTATSDELSQPPVPAKSQWPFLPGWETIALFLVILLIAGIRFRLREMPLERDEGEYAYAGQLILQGIPPYQLAYNMKLPGTYAAYAAIMAVFGDTATGIHLGVIVVNASCTFLIFLIAKRLFDQTAAVVAAATFGLFTIRPQLLGLAGHATHFVVLMALLSIYLLLKAGEARRLWLYFCSGIFSGLALLMKQPGMFFIVFAGFYLLWHEKQAKAGWKPPFTKLASLLGGAALPYLMTCLVLWRAGVFPKFWFWTVAYARTYGSQLTAHQGLREFANRMELQKEHISLISFLLVFGMAAFLWDRKLKPHSIFILGLLAFSFLAVSAGFYYRGHYFIVLYPALALLTGAAVSSGTDLLRKLNLPRVLTIAPVLVFVTAFANALYAERAVYFEETDYQACREIYGTSPFPEAVAIADYIRANSDQAARVAVFGSEPEIYFYAQRHSATGYIYTYPLTEEQTYASTMQSEFIREVEATAPEFVVYVLMDRSWLRHARTDDHIFRWADAYTRDHYSLVGVADGGANHDIYRWGADARSYRPRRPEVVLVYRRGR
jgi:4-amino-4-deoxy-L-arabinose transferase-like glycosyltransferase